MNITFVAYVYSSLLTLKTVLVNIKKPLNKSGIGANIAAHSGFVSKCNGLTWNIVNSIHYFRLKWQKGQPTRV